MPRLWILSDLHLESVYYPNAFSPDPGEFDVLVAAGDIWQGDCENSFRALARLARGKPIVFVMGNHDHWNGELRETLGRAKRLAETHGITLLDGSAATVAGCRFVGATLWSDYRLAGEVDPDRITGEQIDIDHGDGTRLITIGDSAHLHRRARGRLAALLGEPKGLPIVVVTHHAPHPDCLDDEARGTWNAGNSASDVADLSESGRAALWVHGHLHHSIDMTLRGGTRVLCNPAGTAFANPGFDERLVVELR